jgi:hypothetical protein
MHFGVQRTGRRGVAKRRDRFRMPSLPRESDPEVERGNRILRSPLEHQAKRALGLGEFLLLQVPPAVAEIISLKHNRANTPFTGPVSV